MYSWRYLSIAFERSSRLIKQKEINAWKRKKRCQERMSVLGSRKRNWDQLNQKVSYSPTYSETFECNHNVYWEYDVCSLVSRKQTLLNNKINKKRTSYSKLWKLNIASSTMNLNAARPNQFRHSSDRNHLSSTPSPNTPCRRGQQTIQDRKILVRAFRVLLNL